MYFIILFSVEECTEHRENRKFTEANMEKLTNTIFSKDLLRIETIFEKYKKRELAEGQKVTRFAPSPTGFIHVGNLYSALVNERVAHQSGGIFFLRIEDTDEKREVDGAIALVINALKHFGIAYDEGDRGSKEIGVYAPYQQSKRKHIYHTFVRDLMERGLAYPCFCSEEELGLLVQQQKAQNCPRLGYYGNWAKYRNYPAEEALRRIRAGEEYVIRFKSPGNFNNKVVVNDFIRGKLEFPENDLDVVLLKRNGLPTYHFAHVVDDFLMGTTLVIRGEEWLPSIPLHLQLFQAMKWKAPRYAHIAPLLKMDGGNRRKLSKRKDPEANVEYFDSLGYPRESIIEYLINLANSNFEDWRKQNPEKSYEEFPFDIKKMNISGALFDFTKLDSISRNVIGRMSAIEIYENVLSWADKYDKNFHSTLINNRDRIVAIFNMERENTKNVRKDLAKWGEVEREISYFFALDSDEVGKKFDSLKKEEREDVENIVEMFLDSYNPADSKEDWFTKLKTVAKNCGYADNIKDFKQQPEKYRGSITDVAKILRILVTAREQSPDLCVIMKILGLNEVKRRLGYVLGRNVEK